MCLVLNLIGQRSRNAIGRLSEVVMLLAEKTVKSGLCVEIVLFKSKIQISNLYFSTVKIHQVLVQYKIQLHKNI